MTRNGSKILIVYYSLSGITKSIAEKIRAKTGGDMFEIETIKTYPKEYSALIDEAKKGAAEKRSAGVEEKSARYVSV